MELKEVVSKQMIASRFTRHPHPSKSRNWRGSNALGVRSRLSRLNYHDDSNVSNRVIRCRFGRDRLSTTVRFASIPTVNSGLWDFVAMCHLRTFASLTKSLLFPKVPSATKVKGRIGSSDRFFFGDVVDRAADADSNCL